jgi:hypothetical protein
MKSRLLLPTAALLLLGAAGTVSAADMPQQDDSSSGQATMMQNANTSAQSSTDMSYGGVSDTHSAAGWRTRTCTPPRPQCDIFFGQ